MTQILLFPIYHILILFIYYYFQVIQLCLIVLFHILYYLLSKHISLNKKEYIFCLINEFYNKYKVYDLYISPEWKLIYNKKYILNFNKKLITEMYYYNIKNI